MFVLLADCGTTFYSSLPGLASIVHSVIPQTFMENIMFIRTVLGREEKYGKTCLLEKSLVVVRTWGLNGASCLS